MMINTRKFFIVTMLICAFGLITGCGNGNSGDSPAGGGSGDTEKLDALIEEGFEMEYTMNTSISGDIFSGIGEFDLSDYNLGDYDSDYGDYDFSNYGAYNLDDDDDYDFSSGSSGFTMDDLSSLFGNMTTTGVFGAKGDLMWNEMTSMGTSMKQIIKTHSDGQNVTVYYYRDGEYYRQDEMSIDEYMSDKDNEDYLTTTSTVTSKPDFSSFTKTKTATYAGKTCDYYVGSGKEAGTEFAYWAEKEITLYCKTVSEEMTVEMTVTSIKFGNDVTVPSLPN